MGDLGKEKLSVLFSIEILETKVAALPINQSVCRQPSTSSEVDATDLTEDTEGAWVTATGADEHRDGPRRRNKNSRERDGCIVCINKITRKNQTE